MWGCLADPFEIEDSISRGKLTPSLTPKRSLVQIQYRLFLLSIYCDSPSQTNRFLLVYAAPQFRQLGAKLKNSLLTFRRTELSVSIADLIRYADGWLLTCDIARHSEQTLKLRRIMLDKLLWFLLDNCRHLRRS